MKYIINTTLPFLFLFFFIPVTAQRFEPAKVTKAELEEKVHPTDTAAPAAIIYRMGKSYFPASDTHWYMITEIKSRIKIYKKEGYKYASDQFTYYTGGQMTKGYFSDACTYNLEGGQIVKTKLKSDGEFTEKVNKEYERKKMTMPNVREGSIIEYTYTVLTPHFWTLRDWYFEYDIPANYIEYELAIPQCFLYNKYLSGYLTVNKEKTTQNTRVGSKYQDLTDVFWAKDIPAFKEEAYVNNPENYMAILKQELALSNFGEGVKNYSTDWESLSKVIYRSDNFGKELEADSYFKEDLAKVLEGTLTPDDKMNKVFAYVKSRMNWDGKADYYCDKGVKKAYADKTGNVAEINLMLVAMLREAGLKANPVLISTRNNGIALFPSHSSYNYVIAGVEADNSIMLLDATSKYTSQNILPERALNWQGRMIRKDGTSKEIELMPKKNAKNTISVSAVMDKDGHISGKVRDHRQDYYAYIFREKYAGTNEDAYIQKLEKKHNGLEVGAYKREGNTDVGKPVQEEYEFVHKNVADIVGDKIYFSPMLYLTQTENPFKQEQREYPVDFGYPWQDKYMINIALPEGYVAESIPQPVSITMEQNIGSFKYNVVAQNHSLQISVLFDVNYSCVSQDYYKTLKDFFQKVVEKQGEKIVLKKA